MLAVCFLWFGCHSSDLPAAENLMSESYVGSWLVEPMGFGKWVKSPDDSTKEVLELHGKKAGPYWLLGSLPFFAGQFYELSVTVKADEGVMYRYYVACQLPGGEKAFVGEGRGNGQWQTHRVGFSFDKFKGNVKVDKGYVVIMLNSPGSLLISGAEIEEKPNASAGKQ